MISQNFAGEASNVTIQNHVTIQGNITNIPSKDHRQTLTGKFDFI